MEYVADELGVGVLKLPALQRPLSVRADTSAILQLRELIRERRPDVLHTHTAKAGATGRLAALAAGRARPRAVVHTYHGHVLSGYFSRRWERVFRRIERLLAHATGALVAVSDEVRDDLVGFGVAPAERFTVVPYGFDLPEWGAADEARARSCPPRARARGRHARDRLGRKADRDQATARPRADAARGARRRRRRRARARRRRRGPAGGRRRSRASSASPSTAGFVGFQQRIREWYAAVDALAPHLRERGHARRRDRVAGRRAAGRRDAGRRDGDRGRRTARAASCSRSATPPASRGASGELARDPELRARLGRHGAADVRTRFATGRMADELEAVYRQLLA